MIQCESFLNICDNSGALLAKCIKILGSSKKRYAYIGDLLKVSIRKVSTGSKIKKGFVSNSILVRSVFNFKRFDGSYINFFDNSIILLNEKFDFFGTRIFGPVPKELKLNYFLKKKINTLSPFYI